MKTQLATFIKDTPEGKEADAILRSCVHCGFCNATCPTYQLLGDELDGPRGRIYLMKQMLEGNSVSAKTQLHLDRCLTCRSCESTCPSGVKYGRLVDIGRHIAEKHVERPLPEKLKRKALNSVIPKGEVFSPLMKLGQTFKPFLPSVLGKKLPSTGARAGAWPARQHTRKMLVLQGCAQPSLAPNVNAATARVLDKIDITLVAAPNAGCCGTLSYHLNYQADGLDYMRRNIDAWWPYVQQGAEAIVMTASGCGSTVKEYGHLLRNDARYADKAAMISALTRDICEVMRDEQTQWQPKLRVGTRAKLAYHPPCSLQHGQQIKGVTEGLLRAAGFALTPVPDAHLCCGSAGTYSILQEDLSQRLLRNKIEALHSGQPNEIVSSNIGCQTHIQSATAKPVRHWIELIDELL
ncbi:MAG: glycolate oxidase subunit GlcF [Betaproteobacteria bacterium]|nr:glycolate oxidase subunit GlcF [Betaproteobacteria bacterium]